MIRQNKCTFLASNLTLTQTPILSTTHCDYYSQKSLVTHSHKFYPGHIYRVAKKMYNDAFYDAFLKNKGSTDSQQNIFLHFKFLLLLTTIQQMCSNQLQKRRNANKWCHSKQLWPACHFIHGLSRSRRKFTSFSQHAIIFLQISTKILCLNV